MILISYKNVRRNIHGHFLKNLCSCRDKRKIQHLTKDVEDLKSEVKKLRRRLRALEKTEQKKYPSNDPNEEVLEIPHGEPIKVSELTIATRKCLKAPEAVVFLLNALFSKTEIKNCSISGKKTVKCGEEGPRPPLDQVRFRVLERVVFEVFPNFTRKEVREKIQNIQKVERKR